MILLSLRHISKTFFVERGNVRAVYDVSLDVNEGEFFTLLGPSGCGKSTTLRCIAGLERPDDGEIELNGQVVYSSTQGQLIPVNQRDIGMVFQSYAIWPHMNVFDNVAYPLRYGSETHLSKREIQRRVSDSLALVHLGGMEDRPAPQLSGGQQQRVALARALVRNPKLLLLDEPLSNLDAKLREDMRSELRELVSTLGITAVYVTHDQLEALVMSDRIAVMEEGRLVQIATSEGLYNAPANAFVAGFIGATNFLDGQFKRDTGSQKGGVTVTSLGPLHCTAGKEFADGQTVKLAIRPECIEVINATHRKIPRTPKAMNVLEGTIESREFQGDSVVLRVRTAKEVLQVKAAPSKGLDVRTPVYLLISPDNCRAVPV